MRARVVTFAFWYPFLRITRREIMESEFALSSTEIPVSNCRYPERQTIAARDLLKRAFQLYYSYWFIRGTPENCLELLGSHDF